MYQIDISRDITASVQQALDRRLEQLNEVSLVQRSDALLATLPGLARSQAATTAALLTRYHPMVHMELNRGHPPGTMPPTVVDELRELTRAVLLTVGIKEGVSVEAAVGMALVLYKRGGVPFYTVPIRRASAA